ncbi:2-oxoglutarate and Fe(II)-dependent oxygenase superfamily protein, partial [Prunus dulcis]
MLAPPQGTTGHGTGGVGTVVESPTFLNRSPARRRSVLAGNCERTTGTHRNFKASDLPPSATISVDPGSRSAQESTTGPFPASAPPRNVEDFGFGQNTGETLPNFRQKSKGNFKSNRYRKGK